MRKAILLPIVILSSCGYGNVTSPTPATQAQQEAHDYSYKFASIKKVRLDAVQFLPHETYAAWTPCGQHIVVFNIHYIERRPELVKSLAAHEVCHLFYEDQMHCGSSSVGVEERAEACAAEMYNISQEGSN